MCSSVAIANDDVHVNLHTNGTDRECRLRMKVSLQTPSRLILGYVV